MHGNIYLRHGHVYSNPNGRDRFPVCRLRYRSAHARGLGEHRIDQEDRLDGLEMPYFMCFLKSYILYYGAYPRKT